MVVGWHPPAQVWRLPVLPYPPWVKPPALPSPLVEGWWDGCPIPLPSPKGTSVLWMVMWAIQPPHPICQASFPMGLLLISA